MGHFDKVIKDIDLMIKNLRDEEKADIEHRDWCETNQKAAESKNENLQYDMEQLTQKIERATGDKENLDTPPEIMEGEYGGRKSEGTGIIAILSMIKEDIEKDMKVASEEEADALKAYQELTADSQATVDALDAKIVSLGQDIAAKMKAIAEFESF